MGNLRFTRRRKIAPGVRLNLSKSGPSLSFGGRGYHYTVGHHRRRATVGIPGTGVYYTAYSHHHARRRPSQRSNSKWTIGRGDDVWAVEQ
jgi:hypothetical protein